MGIESIAEEAIVIRIVIKTRTTAKDDVARELRLRLKKALDAMDVQLPSLTSIVLTGFEGAASVQGARPPRTTPLPVIAPPAKKARKTRAMKAAEAAAAAAAPAPAAAHPAAPRAAKASTASTAPAAPPAAPQAADAAARPTTTRIPSIARNQAPRSPRTVHLPVQDAAPTFSDAPAVPDAPVDSGTPAAAPPAATAPAAKQPAKPRTRPVDKQPGPKGDPPAKPATRDDGDTHD